MVNLYLTCNCMLLFNTDKNRGMKRIALIVGSTFLLAGCKSPYLSYGPIAYQYRDGFIKDQKGQVFYTYKNGYVFDTFNKPVFTYKNGYVLNDKNKIIYSYQGGYVRQWKTTN